MKKWHDKILASPVHSAHLSSLKLMNQIALHSVIPLVFFCISWKIFVFVLHMQKTFPFWVNSCLFRVTRMIFYFLRQSENVREKGDFFHGILMQLMNHFRFIIVTIVLIFLWFVSVFSFFLALIKKTCVLWETCEWHASFFLSNKKNLKKT